MSQFQPGQSGNPTGRPAGASNKRTQLIKLLEPHAEELINKLVEMAKQGDANAMRLCIERLIPKRKSESQMIALPTIDTSQPSSLAAFRAAILNELAQREEISLDSLKVITELLGQCNESLVQEQENDEMVQRMNELVEKMRRERAEFI